MRLFLYYFSFIPGLALACLSSLSISKKTGIEKADAVKFTVTGFSAGIVGAMLMSYIYNAVMKTVSDGTPVSTSLFSLYGALLFMPVIMLLPLRTSEKYFTALDTCSAGVYMLMGAAKTGCHIYGCCYGIPSSFCVVNPQTGENVFPVQLLEAVLCFLLATDLYLYSVKEKRPKGSVYPLGLLCYGVIRFCIQFLRHHEIEAEKHLVLFMDMWQTVSVIAITAGIVWLAILQKKQKKRSE